MNGARNRPFRRPISKAYMMETAAAARHILSAWQTGDPARLEAALDRASDAARPTAGDERREFLDALIGEIRTCPDPPAADLYRRLLEHIAFSKQI